jgi:hypothetical protein
VAKLIAHLLATAAIWVRISQKYKMRDISKGMAKQTLARKKNNNKNLFSSALWSNYFNTFGISIKTSAYFLYSFAKK